MLFQLISVNVDDSDLSAIHSCQVNLFRSIKRKERLEKSFAYLFKKRLKEEQTRRKKAMERMRKPRLKNVNSCRTSDRVNVFKEFIKSGPCFICIVCNRCPYRISSVVFSENKHKKLINNPANTSTLNQR